MRKWNDWKSHGVATAFQVVEGFRPMSIHNGNQFSGLRLYTQTPRVDVNDVPNPNEWTWVSHQGGLGAGPNTSPDGVVQMVFCAHDLLSVENPENIINFWEGNHLDVDWLLSLPYFTTLGNTPASTTDWNEIVLQLYRAGGWFWTEGGWPPIKGPGTESIDLRPVHNYEFHMDECWDGTTLTSYVDSHNESANTITGTAPSETAAYTSWPWDATFNFNNAAGITNTSDPAITGQLTYEYIGNTNNVTDDQYLCDGRNDGGTWNFMGYQGFRWNWSGQLQYNGSDSSVRHHGVMTGNSSTNTSKLYYGSGYGYTAGPVASGTCSTAMTTLGDNFTIGMRYTTSSKWRGQMSMFRVWGFEFDDDMAEIAWLHNQARMPVYV